VRTPTSAARRVFGEESRRELLNEYFSDGGPVDPADAWRHVYRLLLSADPTTGLARCYESDKAQPGRHWYPRSLAFHDWLSRQLDVSPHELGGKVDWLFRRATELLASEEAIRSPSRALRAAKQWQPYEGRGFPQPGEDPGLEAIVAEVLGDWLTEPPPDVLRKLTQRIRVYYAQENKRKNIVGEGFEDVLSDLIGRLREQVGLTVVARSPLHLLPGFRPPRVGDKLARVDVAVVFPTGRRQLISVKWSIRADRENQFKSDFEHYNDLEESSRNFDFVLVTNEFDAARLTKACDLRGRNTNVFSAVVHVNPQAVLAAYAGTGRGAAQRLPELVRTGRLASLEAWLQSLAGASSELS
jgi:hypothetical protein